MMLIAVTQITDKVQFLVSPIQVFYQVKLCLIPLSDQDWQKLLWLRPKQCQTTSPTTAQRPSRTWSFNIRSGRYSNLQSFVNFKIWKKIKSLKMHSIRFVAYARPIRWAFMNTKYQQLILEEDRASIFQSRATQSSRIKMGMFCGQI